MRPRAIPDLLNRPTAERFGLIAEGMGHLVEHVDALKASVEALDIDGFRGQPILHAVMGEEAAKVLILLDVVRGGWSDQTRARQRLRGFSDHFVRGMYQRVAAINPGTFREVRDYVETLRPAFYLDGPNDADWIFRNEIESARELAFYVDYVQEEEGHRWVTPRGGLYPSLKWPATITSDLIAAMSRIGLLSAAGLAIVSRRWEGVVVEDHTTFAEHYALISDAIGDLIDAKLLSDSASQNDVNKVADRWPFPLTSLDLTRIDVSSDELDRQRERIQDAFWEQELGPFF